MGAVALRKIQLGRESTAGTAVAATAIWRGTGVASDDREFGFINEQVGMLAGVDNGQYEKLKSASIPFDSVEATFEQLPHVLEAGVKTVGTGAADGAGSGKVYTYPFPTTSANTIKTYTIEGGDNSQAYEMEYAYVKKFSLSGRGQEAVMLSANWGARQLSKASFTGALSVPTVEPIMFQKSTLSIDDAASGFGTTEVSNLLMGFTLNVTTGWTERWTNAGDLYFGYLAATTPEITLDITFEHLAGAVAEYDKYAAKTPRLIQLEFTGSATTTPGTTYSNKTMILKLPGVWEKFGPLSDENGNNTVTGTFRVKYNSTAASAGSIIVVNELAAVP